MAKWFYLIDGESCGPIEAAVLKQLATAGRLQPTDKVRRADMAQWHEAKQVKELFANAEQHAAAVVATANKRHETTSAIVSDMAGHQRSSVSQPASGSDADPQPAGIAPATKITLAICGTIFLPILGFFVWFVAFRDPWEAINSEAVTAQLDKADQLQQTDVNAAYTIYDDVLNETKHHKLKNEELITRLAHAEKSRETVYQIIQAKARAEEAERKRQADAQARREEEAEKKRQADAQARREAAEKERLAQKEQTTVRTGDDARLATRGGSQVFVCVTESALSRFTDLAVAKDYLGMAGMEGAGQVFPVPSGTKVKVIDRGVFKSEVRVMEGQHIGDSGFVPAEFVTK